MAHKLENPDFFGLHPKEATFVLEYCAGEFSARNAAERSGYSPEHGYKLLKKEHVKACVDRILAHRKHTSDINAEHVLKSAEMHRKISLHLGQMTAANRALDIIAKHTFVNAYAPDKVEVTTDKDILERLQRGRARAFSRDEPSFF